MRGLGHFLVEGCFTQGVETDSALKVGYGGVCNKGRAYKSRKDKGRPARGDSTVRLGACGRQREGKVLELAGQLQQMVPERT